MKTVIGIPARLGSSRFPGKPLANICGISMLEHVYKRCAFADNVDEIRSDIEQGKKVWVYAQAKVYCKGIELGDGSMGGLLYKDYDGIKKEIFEEDHQGIVHEALREARASMKYLREVKIPAEEQLTSQFMEGQVW